MSYRQDQGRPFGSWESQQDQQPQAPQQGYQWPQQQQWDPYGQSPGQSSQMPSWQQGPRLPQIPPRRKRHIARNVLAGIGGLVLVIVVIAVAAGGNHHTIQSTGTGGTGAGSTTKTETASIGTAITLAGYDNGEQMSVTVTKVIHSAKPADEFNQAPAGDRLYAVQFRLRDTGSIPYSDAPSNGAAVTDSKGQSYQPEFETVTGCQAFPGTENIESGSSGLGCIVFEVPRSAVITQVQFTLDSGFGPQTGQWDVAGQH